MTKEVFVDQLDEETKIKVLNRIIEFAISHSKTRMTDFKEIQATEINKSLTQLTKEDDEALAKNLQREIRASEIKVDKQILEKAQETTLPSTPIKDQTTVTSRAVYEGTPDAKFDPILTPLSRKLATKLFKVTPVKDILVKDILVTDDGVVEKQYLSKNIEKEKIASAAGSESPAAAMGMAGAAGRSTRPATSRSLFNESPAASSESPDARSESTAARSTNPDAAMGMAGSAGRSTSQDARNESAATTNVLRRRTAASHARTDDNKPAASRSLFW